MNKKERAFVETVWEFHLANNRTHLPWRKTTDPYKVLVSEIMLQQTQVDRVIPKYRHFITNWPTLKKLAKASLGEVLIAWQGLGYNRRAKYLHEASKAAVTQYKGKLPLQYRELQKLPGIGPYTAAAVMSFAYNEPVPMIETNIRTVFIYHFFRTKEHVSDHEILRLVSNTLPAENPKEWYAALMDYGAYLKQIVGNTNKQSRSYTKQSKFIGSDRQIRGAIIKFLATNGSSSSIQKISAYLVKFEKERVEAQVINLLAEGLIIRVGRWLKLP